MKNYLQMLELIWHSTTTKSEYPRQDKEHEIMAEKHNKVIIVIVITLFSKCNISYGKIIMNISNDSAIELLRVKNSYESVIKTTKNARYANKFASSVHNENIISNNNLKSMDQIKYLPQKNLNITQQGYLLSKTSRRVDCDQKLKNNEQTTTVLSELNKNNSIISNMAIFSMFPIFLTFGNISTLLRGNFQLNNQFKMRTIASNKNYDDNGHYKQQFRFKRQGNLLYDEKKENPRESFFTNRLKNREENDGVKPTAKVLEVGDGLRNEPTPRESLLINSQEKEKKGKLVYNWKRGAHFQPRSKFKLPIKGEKLMNKHLKGAVTKDQNYAINNKHNFKRTRFLSNRQKDTTINKLVKRSMHINTIRAKRVEMEPQESIESDWNELELSSRLVYINEALYPTTGLNEWNQLPIVTANDLSSSYHPGTISKLHYQRDIDIGQDFQQNGRLDNENNYLTLNYFFNSTKATIPKHVIRQQDNVINVGDTFLTPALRTMKYKLNTQMVIQTDHYLPSFNDLDNSNNNISFRSMPYAPSENRNQTVTQPTKKITQKIFKSKKNKNTKAELSEVFITQFKMPKKHKKIQQTVVNVKQSRITKKYMKMLSTKYKSKTSKASKKRTSQIRKEGNSKKTVSVIKTSEHRKNIKKVTIYVTDRRASSKRIKKMKWHKTSSKKKKSNQATSSKKAKKSMNKKHSTYGRKYGKRVYRNTANEDEITTMDLQHIPTSYLARMGVSESDIVKALKLTDRQSEILERAEKKRTANVGGIFNSYHHFWNNNNNHYYYYSSAITDRNVVNNLIVIDFDTSPPTSSTESTTLPLNETTAAPATICSDLVNPTVFFIKKKTVTDYSIVVAALVLVGLAFVVCCCCGCAPIYILRRRKKCCPPKCCPPKCPED